MTSKPIPSASCADQKPANTAQHQPARHRGYFSAVYRMLRTLAGLLVFALCLFCFPGCFSPGSVRYSKQVRIRLKWYHQAQFAGFYVAKEKGFFAAEGLDVELDPGTRDEPAIQMVAAGRDDFGVATAEDIVLARSVHVPVEAVAVIFQQTPFCFVVRKETGINDLSQLKGMTVGVQPGNHEVLTYRAMLRGANPPMSESDIKPIFVGDSLEDMMAVFVRAGTVVAWPAYSINEPLYLAKHGIQTQIIRPSQYGVNIYGDTLFTTDEMINDHPDVVSAIVSAVRKGWKYAAEHQPEAVELTLKQDHGLDPELQTAMLAEETRNLIGSAEGLGTMTDEGWFKVYHMLLVGNFILPDPDFRKAYTTRFVRK